jgi:hypothetical protein
MKKLLFLIFSVVYLFSYQANESFIDNNPNLKVIPILTISTVGEGVTPIESISPAQARVLARRAAINDAYRALSEKLYGVRLTAKDTVKDFVVKNSEIKTVVYGLIKGASFQDVSFKDGLFRINAEVKINMCDWQQKLNCNIEQCIYNCNK